MPVLREGSAVLQVAGGRSLSTVGVNRDAGVQSDADGWDSLSGTMA